MNSIKVLYIDDESLTEKMKSRFDILEDYDIKVQAESDLRNVVNNLTELIQNKNIIIMDLIMPPGFSFDLEETNGGSMTGLAVIKKIREINKKIPIMIVSIKGKNSIEQNIIENFKISEVINKSVPTIELVALIKQYAI